VGIELLVRGRLRGLRCGVRRRHGSARVPRRLAPIAQVFALRAFGAHWQIRAHADLPAVFVVSPLCALELIRIPPRKPSSANPSRAITCVLRGHPAALCLPSGVG
jgi:hypothetical protein